MGGGVSSGGVGGEMGRRVNGLEGGEEKEGGVPLPPTKPSSTFLRLVARVFHNPPPPTPPKSTVS